MVLAKLIFIILILTLCCFSQIKPDSIRYESYETGELKLEIPYCIDKINGVIKCYYKNGILKYQTPYKNGKKHGMALQYHESGALKAQAEYENDKQIGEIKYYEDVKKETDSFLKADEKIEKHLESIAESQRTQMLLMLFWSLVGVISIIVIVVQ